MTEDPPSPRRALAEREAEFEAAPRDPARVVPDPTGSAGSAATAPVRSRLFSTFLFAGAGIAYLIRSQRNARIHLAAAIVACVLAGWLRLGRTDWAILVLTIAIVFAAEGFNTAIEAAVDLASPALHPLAKTAKDVAAAMVLLAALAAIVVGTLLFAPPIISRLR